MAISVDFFTIPGSDPPIAIQPDDISFGTAGGDLTIAINSGGTVDEVQLQKRSVTFNVRGVPVETIESLEQLRSRNLIDRVNGRLVAADLSIGGFIIQKASLATVVPQRIVTIENTTIMDAQLEYRSSVFS